MNEHILHTVLPASGELGKSGAMRLSGYQHLICAAAELDLTTRNMSIGQTIAKGYAWAITSLTVDVTQPVTGCDPLSARTWISSDRQPINRRELQFLLGDNECFRAAVFSTPVSVETHRIIRLDAGDAGCVGGPLLVDNAVSRITSLPEMEEVSRREVFPSDIDALGHMNNCRYGALAYDVLTESERELLTGPFRFTIIFRRQFFQGDTVVLCRGADDRGIFVTGSQPDSDKPSFIVWLEPQNQ
ncbi:MAG: hypothetical protein E7554_05400 [Ruminococcaceae bacterium]|nr:hypothetical protein [Oscillospiraceae bacterium]